MAAVRDPAFWRRFSVAIHLDEEKARVQTPSSNGSSQPPLKHTDTWLERNRKKNKRSQILGCVIAMMALLAIAAVIVIILWFAKAGPFAGIHSEATA